MRLEWVPLGAASCNCASGAFGSNAKADLHVRVGLQLQRGSLGRCRLVWDAVCFCGAVRTVTPCVSPLSCWCGARCGSRPPKSLTPGLCFVQVVHCRHLACRWRQPAGMVMAAHLSVFRCALQKGLISDIASAPGSIAQAQGKGGHLGACCASVSVFRLCCIARACSGSSRRAALLCD